MNEGSTGLGRLTRGKNFVPKFHGKLFEDEDLKRRKIGETGPRKACHAPSTCTMCLMWELSKCTKLFTK